MDPTLVASSPVDVANADATFGSIPLRFTTSHMEDAANAASSALSTAIKTRHALEDQFPGSLVRPCDPAPIPLLQAGLGGISDAVVWFGRATGSMILSRHSLCTNFI